MHTESLSCQKFKSANNHQKRFLLLTLVSVWIGATILHFFSNSIYRRKYHPPFIKHSRNILSVPLAEYLTHHADHRRKFLRDGSSKIDVEEWLKMQEEEDVLQNEVETFPRNGSSNFNLEEWLKEQESRKSRIQNFCNGRRDLQSMFPDNKEFIYDPFSNLLYCRHGKVGTTTWLKQILTHSNQSESIKEDLHSSRKLHNFVPDLFALEEDPRDLIKSAISFSMVRHPFERLVSAYQDKMIDRSDLGYLDLRRRIMRTFGDISFVSFVKNILRSKAYVCRDYWSCHFDIHWRPFVSRCFYCQVPYQFILKMETFQDDIQGLAAVTNISFSGPQTHKSKGNTSSLTKKYLETLPYQLLKDLIRLYEADFQMFDYDPLFYSKNTF